MNPLGKLQKEGQSLWLDYIRRNLVTGGELSRLVTEDGLRGVTSNPTIFEKAIAGSTDYDDALRATLREKPHAEAGALFETLAIEDIRMAADVLRPIYDETKGADGFVSLEVSPRLAHDTAGTVAEAKRLWRALSRPNILIKVPATPEGIPAIEALIAAGTNVNVTLMFSLTHYEAVAQAYLKGLARCQDPQKVASVASFFISRVDTVVDRNLETVGTPKALALRGKIAIANARKVYQRFQEIFYGEPFAALKKQGAHVQRPLWASTGTKNPAYSDVVYIEELVGPDTVNTVPPATLDAFRAHGKVRGTTVTTGQAEADAALAGLRKLGIDLEAITEKLQADGVASFAASYDQLLGALDSKRKVLLAKRESREQSNLGQYREAVEQRLKAWKENRFACRLWKKDPTLWAAKPVPEITDRLGWLKLPEAMHDQLDDLLALAERAKAEGVRHVVLLGMGGSSLAPEVFQKSFGSTGGHPELIVLDSTHPSAVRAVGDRIELAHTLFLISSKSGTTTETLSFYRYFWQRLIERKRKPGPHFIAITDHRTPLERLARERKFRRTFPAPADVGGRYSALSVFGLVPAALVGVDIHRVLDRAWRMVESCAFCVDGAENPGLALGAALGELALAGRDKVTFLTSPSLASFPAWIEQLIAESTGKNDKGILPVADEPARSADAYGSDRLFVSIGIGETEDPELRERVAALRAAGHPVIELTLADMGDLGGEFFRWQVAVAAAGAVLGILPFNQPDVQLAKELARQAMGEKSERDGDASEGTEPVSISESETFSLAVRAWLAGAKEGDYFSLQAYLAPTPETSEGLETVRRQLGERTGLATTSGYGPRFLHSTGQLHKGGPNTGLFLQIVDEPGENLSVPETDYTFGALIEAQAWGDFKALRQRGRRILRVNMGKDVAGGLKRLADVVHG